MRCLHCGNEVSLLHKLTDAQFCSAEHRQHFYDEQQRLILQRLQASAARFRRYRPDVPSVVVQPPPPEATAPAGIAAFHLSQPPEAHARPVSLVMLGCFEVAGSKPAPPSRVNLPGTLAYRLSPLLCDIPWAKYNPGLRSFAEITPICDHDRMVGGLVQQARIRDWVGLSASRLIATRRRSAINRPLVFAAWPVEPSRESLSVKPDMTTRALRRNFGTVAVGLPAPRVLSVLTSKVTDYRCVRAVSVATDCLVAEGTVSLTALRCDAATHARGMAFLDRVFRMRPRSGVPGSGIAPYQPIEARTEALPVSTALRNSARLVPADFAFQPSGVHTFFRARPRSGVTADCINPCAPIDPGSTLHAPHPTPEIPVYAGRELCSEIRYAQTAVSLPATPATFARQQSHLTPCTAADCSSGTPLIPQRIHPKPSAFAPGTSDRLFRMRPRSGVADANIAGLVVSAGDEPFRSEPAMPGTHTHRNFAPAPSQRMFHGRPRGPVSRATTAFDNVAPGGLALSPLQPVMAQTRVILPDAAPRSVERVFRPKPRGPVAGGEIPASLSCAGVPLLSQPPTPAMLARAQAPVHDAYEPVLIRRLYRYSPRGPVARIPAPYEQVPHDEIAFVSQYAYPSKTPTAPDLAPAVSSRILRARPRNGVIAAPVADVSGQSAAYEPLVSAPAIAAMRLADCAPDLVTRPFRMRARTGVTSTAVADFEHIRTQAQSVEMRAASPQWQPAVCFDLALRSIDRMYRMRLRASAAGGPDLLPIEAAPQDFPPRASVAYRRAAACAPAEITRLFRPRMRAPIDVAPGFSAIACFAFHAEGNAVRGGYRLGCGTGPSPAFVNRMYRIRARLPLDDAATQNAPIRFKHLPPSEPEASLPALPVSILDAPSPAQLDKLYRMRPRNGRQGARENLAIDCAPLAGTGTPDAYAGPAGTGSIAGIAARDALQQLTKKWNTIPKDLKAMVMVVPVLVLLSLIPFGGKESSVAHASTVDTAGVQHVLTQQLGRVEQEIRGRAAFAVEEDFRSGLERWDGADGWRETWSMHPSGWVAPGQLALLKPSLALKDYRAEFSAQIVSRAFGFVVRASDTSNYHAIKFTLCAKPKTVPTMTVVRTLVIAGKEVRRNETTVPVPVARDTVYPVTIDVKDQYFTLMIRDKVVDFWSDAQLKSGGIGFFVDHGEKALIHDIKVRYQYDALGRLVAATLPAER